MSIHRRDTAKGTRYDVRLRNAEGKTYTRTWRTRKDAETYERAELTARDRGDWIDPSARRRTFREVADDWLSSNPAKRPGTIANERAALERHVLPVVGAKRLASIGPGDMQTLVKDLSQHLAPRSVRRVMSTTRAICHYAIANDITARSPLRGVKLPALDPPAVHVFTPAELTAIADALPADYRPMVWLGAVLGLRWSEVAGLTAGAVDILGRTLSVTHAVTRGAKGDPVLASPKSDAGRRTLAMPAPLADLMSAHMAAIGATAATPTKLLFPSWEGGLLRYTNWLRRIWHPAMITAGLGRRLKDPATGRSHYVGPGFHDLRRTSATALVVEGVDVKTAQYRLGHSSPVLTLEVYAQAVPEAERRAADTVGARLMTG